MTARSSLQKLARENRCEITDIISEKMEEILKAQGNENIAQYIDTLLTAFVIVCRNQQVNISERLYLTYRNRIIYSKSTNINEIVAMTGLHPGHIRRIIKTYRENKGRKTL